MQNQVDYACEKDSGLWKRVYMKRADKDESTESEQAIKQVLLAERDAENAIRDCEDEAHAIIQ